MKRYGRSGWFGQSHRHYLAAKGISTKKYYSPRISGDDLGLQEHRGAKKFDKEKFEESVRKVRSVPMLGKPSGAFWTSSVKDDGSTSWKEWTEDQCASKESDKSFRIIPEEDANIFSIDDEEDLEWLESKYPKKVYGLKTIDWEKVARDFDGVRVTDDALYKNGLRLRMRGDGEDRVDLYTWDAESTAWFNKKFKDRRDVMDEYGVPTSRWGPSTDKVRSDAVTGAEEIKYEPEVMKEAVGKFMNGDE